MDIHGPFKSGMKPGSREDSASPAWLAAPSINAHDTVATYTGISKGWTLDLQVLGTIYLHF